MSQIKPWGHIDWILPHIGVSQWSVISCASFEKRSVALATHIDPELLGASHLMFRIVDPPSKFSGVIERETAENAELILKLLPGEINDVSLNLLFNDLGLLRACVSEIALSSDSIILDISAMPKRLFALLIKLLLKSDVKNILVTYTGAASYKEGQLTGNALPAAALPGFSRESSDVDELIVVVGVGYMAFNLDDLLEREQGRSVKFLFPFPPGSPAARRNWGLLRRLQPETPLPSAIQRIHAMDMFEVLSWLQAIAREGQAVDMIPLGPKPHALAMVLAQIRIGASAELIYAQPKFYHPEYSSGIARTNRGLMDITGYCLRRNGIEFV